VALGSMAYESGSFGVLINIRLNDYVSELVSSSVVAAVNSHLNLYFLNRTVRDGTILLRV
jgi:hypothetical protein